MIDNRSPMFAYTCNMNIAFGNPAGNPADLLEDKSSSRFQAAMHTLKQQVKNIPVEYEELMLAIALGDVDKIRDGLCDIVVFALGAFHKLGLDADDDMRAVLDGVMSRFCHTEQDVLATAAKWANLGVKDVVAGGAYPRAFLKCSKDTTSKTGEFIPAGKFLKSVNTREPVFTPIAPNAQEDLPLETSEAEAVVPPRRFMGQQLEQQAQQAPNGVNTAQVTPPETALQVMADMARDRLYHKSAAEAWERVRATALELFTQELDKMTMEERAEILLGVKALRVNAELTVQQQ